MLQKQIKRIFMPLTSVIVAGFFLATIFNLASSDTSFAIGNCPGAEIQGNGTAPLTDTKKCYANNQPTASVPTGTQTTPADNAGTATNTQADESTTDKGVTCAVEKIGWILCPIIEGAAKISDKGFDILADNFLRTDPELVNDKSGTKVGWEVARNLANIMFIIAFLIIILSQVTGQGLNNYGIKKMLPRLIIAAIAVNVSYYICQLAVDLTNIIGYEIQNAMGQIANTVGPSVFGQASNYADTEVASTAVFENGALLTMIATGALGLGVAVYFLLPTMLALIPLILITVMTVIIILLLRKALIVLLIVISPIAFVLYLLPNTEKYFSKWMSMFGKLLMVFPIVGLLFGAGQLASTIILVAGSDGTQAIAAANCDPDNPDSKAKFDEQKKGTSAGGSICGEKYVKIKGGKDGNNTCFVTTTNSCPVEEPKNISWTLGLVAMGIAVAPLLAVWSVLQGALSAAGAIGGKLTSAVSKGMGGLGKPANSAAGALSKRMKENRSASWQRRGARGLSGEGGIIDGVAGGLAKRRGDRALRQNLSKQALDRATNHAVNTQDNVRSLTSGLIKDEQDRALRSVQAQEDHHAAEEMKNALTAIEYFDESATGGVRGKLAGAGVTFDRALAAGDFTQIKASIQALMTTGEKGINSLEAKLDAATGTKLAGDIKEYMLQAHSNLKEKSAAGAAWAASGPSNTTSTVSDFAAAASTYQGLNDKQFASQTENNLRSNGAQAALAEMSDTADGGQQSRGYRLLSNTETANELNDIKRGVISPNAQKIDPPSPPPTP